MCVCACVVVFVCVCVCSFVVFGRQMWWLQGSDRQQPGGIWRASGVQIHTTSLIHLKWSREVTGWVMINHCLGTQARFRAMQKVTQK